MSDSGNDKKRSSGPRLPVTGRVTLKFPDFETMVNRLSRHLSQDGVFIPTNEPKPTGTVLALVIRLADGRVVLEAEGDIIWTRRG